MLLFVNRNLTSLLQLRHESGFFTNNISNCLWNRIIFLILCYSIYLWLVCLWTAASLVVIFIPKGCRKNELFHFKLKTSIYQESCGSDQIWIKIFVKWHPRLWWQAITLFMKFSGCGCTSPMTSRIWICVQELFLTYSHTHTRCNFSTECSSKCACVFSIII